jgi:hypothetical protein
MLKVLLYEYQTFPLSVAAHALATYLADIPLFAQFQ